MVYTYTVYVQTDCNSIITAVNSSAFLTDTDGWTAIDEGSGDKYHHAQGHYLPEGLVDGNGLYNYKLVDGTVTARTAEEKAPELDRLNAQAQIAELKAKLAATDYIAAKLAEGAATTEEYAEELAQRAIWRKRINQLEV